MRFQQFIHERGPPFRVCDLFDEFYDSVQDTSAFSGPIIGSAENTSYFNLSNSSSTSPSTFPAWLIRLNQKLLENESGNYPIEHIMPDTANEAHKRIHQVPFPMLDACQVDQLTFDMASKKNKNVHYNKAEPRFVPQGRILDRQIFKAEVLPDKKRVICDFIADIFNQHITEALKRRNTIRYDLKSRPLRRSFVDELYHYLIPLNSLTPADALSEFSNYFDYGSTEKRSTLSWEQFELIVDLLDEALCQESQSENSGIVPIVMDLCNNFYTQLKDERYYMSMTPQIQRHAIWEQTAFWENVFNDQVNKQIRQLYLHNSEQEQQQQKQSVSKSTANAQRSASPDTTDKQGSNVRIVKASYQPVHYTPNMSTLEIAAEEMRIGHLRPKNLQDSLELQEESTIHSQLIHVITLIVKFRISVDAGMIASGIYGDLGPSNECEALYESQSVMTYHSASGQSRRENVSGLSDRLDSSGRKKNKLDATEPYLRDVQSGAAVHDANSRSEVGRVRPATVLDDINRLETWLRKFVGKVTDRNGLKLERATDVAEKIQCIIEGHLLDLQRTYPEVKNIPKAKKPEITRPVLLTNEVAIPIGGFDCLRCQLLVDDRYERTDWQRLDTVGDITGSKQLLSVSPDKTASGTSSVGVTCENEFELDVMLRPLLPAQGALFVTNYRLIFTGFPKDPYQSNKVINRSFPIAALHSIKKHGIQMVTTIFPATTSIQQNPISGKRKNSRNQVNSPSELGVSGQQRGLVRVDENLEVCTVRALTMQMLKLAFDPDEVALDVVNHLRQLLTDLRYPNSYCLSFNPLPANTSLEANKTILSSLPVERTTVGSKQIQSKNRSFSATVPQTSNTVIDSGSSWIGLAIARSPETARLISITLKTSAAGHLSPVLVHVLRNSIGYLDMARFCVNSASDEIFSYKRKFSTASPVQSDEAIENSSTGSQCVGARLVSFNTSYEMVKSYPALLVVPQSVDQACLMKVARSHHEGRFPVITWQHPETGAFLLRGSNFYSKTMRGALKQVGTTGPMNTLSPERDGSGESGDLPTAQSSKTTKEQARYLLALVDMSFGVYTTRRSSVKQTGNSSPYDGLNLPDHNPSSTMHTSAIASPASEHVLMNDRRSTVSRMSGEKTRSLNRLAGVNLTVRETSKGSKVGSFGSVQDGDGSSVNSNSNLNLRGIRARFTKRNMSKRLGVAGALGAERDVSLYVLGEKPMMKNFEKHSSLPSVQFVTVDFVSTSEVVKSFKGFFKACLPNAASSGTSQFALQDSTDGSGVHKGSANVGTSSNVFSTHSVHATIQECGWLNQIQRQLELAICVSNLMDFRGATVALCLEDGVGAVTQIVSLVQIMSDPTYRTLAGFCALIEKEWCMFGHRFNQHLNQTSKSDSVAPVFLQFLDAVHQLLHQFPLAFEFNDFFLEFLAYHHCSNRFHNFKHNCEFDRFNDWFINVRLPDAELIDRYNERHSIWSYIQKQHEEWPVFFNFRYSVELSAKVLRPATNLASLIVWKYYLCEDLATGPVYDLDHFSPSYRKHTNPPYEPVIRQGFNNSHIEKIYSLLGLRQSEDSVGWKRAWERAKATIVEPIPHKPFNNHLLMQKNHVGASSSRKVVLKRLKKPDDDDDDNDKLPSFNGTNRSTSMVDDIFSNHFPAKDTETEVRSDSPKATVVRDKSQELSVYVDSEDESGVAVSADNGVLNNGSFYDECTLARLAMEDYHRGITLRRIALSTAAGDHHSMETGLGSSLGNESDSLAGESVRGSIKGVPTIMYPEDASATLVFSKAHHFVQAATIGTNIRCQYCNNFLIPFGANRSVARCSSCNYLCHEKCAPFVPKFCRSAYTSGTDTTAKQLSSTALNLMNDESQHLNADDSRWYGMFSPKPPWRNNQTLTMNSSTSLHGRSSTMLNTQTHSEGLTRSHIDDSNAILPCHIASAECYGFLQKMGHRKVLQKWKDRFFVLDTKQNQLRYYDTPRDEVPRRCIDLQEVRAVRVVKNSSFQRRGIDYGMFELETNSRTFRFAAETTEKASEWVECIQNAIQ